MVDVHVHGGLKFLGKDLIHEYFEFLKKVS